MEKPPFKQGPRRTYASFLQQDLIEHNFSISSSSERLAYGKVMLLCPFVYVCVCVLDCLCPMSVSVCAIVPEIRISTNA